MRGNLNEAEEERLREALWAIQAGYKFMMDDSAVTELPKPTWKEWGRQVYEQTQDALSAWDHVKIRRDQS